MSVIEWQDSYSVDVPVIDADHQVIVSLMNQLLLAREEHQGGEVIGSVLNVLIEYTVSHFLREERLMELGGYPDLDAHRELHRALTDKLLRFMTQFADGRDDAADELCQFLKDWLVLHILSVDKRYKPYVEQVQLDPDDLSGTFGRAEPEGRG